MASGEERALTGQLKLGFVGLGGVAQEHMRAAAASRDVVLVAGADLVEERRSHASGMYGINTYKDYSEMMDQEPLDAVCVLTPAAWHRPVVEAACTRGLHVLCEKPLAVTEEDAVAIRDSVISSGVVGQFGASYRFLPAVQAAREIIRAGGIGEVRLCLELAIGGQGAAAVQVLSAAHYPPGGPGGTGMGLLDHGVHMIDAFSWLTGAKVEAVTGRANISGKAPRAETVTLFMEHGILGQLVYDEGTYSPALPAEGVFTEGAGWNLSGFIPEGSFDASPCVFAVYGSEGAMRIYPYANILLQATRDGLRSYRLPEMPNLNHFRNQLDAFAAGIRQGRCIAADMNDGLAAMRVLLGVYASMASGQIEYMDRL